jgi:uncharacterized protein (DUF58 family)
MSPSRLLGPDLLPRLERLEVAFRRVQRGRPEGRRSGEHRGGRIEFADYRDYAPGDDFRYVDWNVLGRTDSLVVKQFEREEQYLLLLLLDASGSMGFPTDARRSSVGPGSGGPGGGRGPTKLEYAAASVAALAYVAMAAGHRVELAACSDGACSWSVVGADKSRIVPLIDQLGALEASGRTDLALALREAAERSRERCLLVLASDLLVAGADGHGGAAAGAPGLGRSVAQDVLASLAGRGYDCSVIHVVSPDEIDPPMRGRMILRDAESATTTTLRITDAAAAAYRRAFREHGERWAAFCGRHGVRFLSTTTAVPFEDFVMRYLRQGGLVR